jgi:hypothetical protein
MYLRSGDDFPDVLVVPWTVVDYDPKFPSDVFRAHVKGMCSCINIRSARAARRTTRTPTLSLEG